MPLELRSAEVAALKALWSAWRTRAPGGGWELEASVMGVDMVRWRALRRHLFALGGTETVYPERLVVLFEDGVRLTVEGADAVERLRRGDVPGAVPFVAERKSNVAPGAVLVALPEYEARVRLRSEEALANDDAVVAAKLLGWATTPKAIRYMRRVRVTGVPGAPGIAFDLSAVRESPRGAGGEYQRPLEPLASTMSDVARRDERYEVELEVVDAGTAATLDGLLSGLGTALTGLHGTPDPLRKSVRDNALTSLAKALGSAPPLATFPGPQPAVLERVHLTAAAPLGPRPALLSTNAPLYSATDKADGLRCLAYVTPDLGDVVLIDASLRVYGTGLRAQGTARGAVLDGEWLQDARAFLAFDAIAGMGGAPVAGLPLLQSPLSGVRALSAAGTRLGAAADVVRALRSAETRSAAIKPCVTFHLKRFYVAPGLRLLTEAAATALGERPDTGPRHDTDYPGEYTTDGLIFTPVEAPMPLTGRTWPALLKWKDAANTTVDFLVCVPRAALEHAPRDAVGVVLERALRVGSRAHAALLDPRAALLNGDPLPRSLTQLEVGDYGPREFIVPGAPHAGVAHFPVMPDGLTLACRADCLSNAWGDVVPTDKDVIIEMRYDAGIVTPTGERRDCGWAPLRVRWDKTERYARGERSRTLNADWVAQMAWAAINAPVTVAHITGAEPVPPSSAYYEEAGGSVSGSSRGAFAQQASQLRAFHNLIKSELLLRPVFRAVAAADATDRDGHGGNSRSSGNSGNSGSSGSSGNNSRGDTSRALLLDVGCGRGGDLHKWAPYGDAPGARFVLGVDTSLPNLVDPIGGAYRRLLEATIRNEAVPPVVFAHADATQPLIGREQPDAPLLSWLLTPNSAALAHSVPLAVRKFRGILADGADVVSHMFSVHYMFEDAARLAAWRDNLRAHLRVGGYVVGCCFDARAVFTALNRQRGDAAQDEIALEGHDDNGRLMWRIASRDVVANTVPHAHPERECDVLRRRVAVSFVSITSDAVPEMLVPWEKLQWELAKVGCRVLTSAEAAQLGIPAGTGMFEEAHGWKRPMRLDATMQRFSWLNRWFVFKRVQADALDARVVPMYTHAVDDAVWAPIAAAPATAAPAITAGPEYLFHRRAKLSDDLGIGAHDWLKFLAPERPLREPLDGYTTLLDALKASTDTDRVAVALNAVTRLAQRPDADGAKLSTILRSVAERNARLLYYVPGKTGRPWGVTSTAASRVGDNALGIAYCLAARALTQPLTDDTPS